MMPMLARVLAVLALALAAAPAARAESSPCPGNMSSYFNLKNGDSITCTCPPLSGGHMPARFD